MSVKLLIDNETAPVVGSEGTSFIKPANDFYLTLSAAGLQGAEEIVVEFENVDGSWEPATNNDGDVKLTAEKRQVLIIGTGRYRVSKGTTTSAVSVGVQ